MPGFDREEVLRRSREYRANDEPENMAANIVFAHAAAALLRTIAEPFADDDTVWTGAMFARVLNETADRLVTEVTGETER